MSLFTRIRNATTAFLNTEKDLAVNDIEHERWTSSRLLISLGLVILVLYSTIYVGVSVLPYLQWLVLALSVWTVGNSYTKGKQIDANAAVRVAEINKGIDDRSVQLAGKPASTATNTLN